MKTRSRSLLLLLAILAFSLIMAGCGAGSAGDADGEGEADQSGEAGEAVAFASWNPDAPALATLKEYVEDVTDEDSPDYIPVKDRLAVFDMDGTLYAELAPIYIEWWMYAYRVNEDSSFTPDEAEKEVADQIVEAAKTGVTPDNLELDHAVQNARAYAGMTIDAYRKYVREFVRRDAVGFEGLTYKDAFFRPMAEVIDYLNANEFTVYICSGTDRFLCRELTDGELNVDDDHIIGMDVMLKASGQGDEDGLEYTFESDDKVIRTDELLTKTVKMNKVSLIARELGQQPVLRFGNSSGDESMHAYTVDDNPFRSMAFMVVADDDQRDYGNLEEAKKREDKWRENNWEVISMKNDFATIYGEGVRKTAR